LAGFVPPGRELVVEKGTAGPGKRARAASDGLVSDKRGEV